MKFVFKFCFSLIFLLTPNIWSAACCGGGFAVPSIISGDDQAQVTTSLTYTDVVVSSVDSRGIWHTQDQNQKTETFKLDLSRIFFDRYQFGISIPMVRRSYLGSSYSHLGDISTSLGYEYLPDWNYHPYRPKGIGFVQIQLPTGKSKIESDLGGVDSSGNGLYSLGIGTLLTKTIKKFDFFSILEVHKTFNKKVNTDSIKGEVLPGYGSSIGFGMGYNYTDYRIGSSLNWVSEDPIDIQKESELISGYSERYTQFIMSLSYLAHPEWAATLSYQDQSLFGDPRNTSLNRGVSFVLQHRIPR